ncbi:MAG: outer membrane beta-barrel protein, partial [Candidatus Eiseniibacteriota bacterium]
MRRILPALFVVALLLAVSPARAELVATFYPGVTMPTSDFAADSLGNAKTGFQFAAALDTKWRSGLSLGVEIFWGVNNTNLEGETINQGGGFYTRADQNQYEMRQYGARLRYFIPTRSNFHPYALVALGAYDINLKSEVAFGGPVPTAEVKQKGETDLGTNFGGRLGLGFEYEASPKVILGLSAEHNHITMDKNDFGSSTATF